ncbi:MAG: YjbH domain-containing protein [SAR86 cluster bacterium]|nr:YjbH domain-containing protein [SAR86 cluster bacterium]
MKKSSLKLILFTYLLPFNIGADSFNYNSYNNHGVLGLINTPSARFYNEGSYGITLYDGTPDQKITMTSSPYDWLEASFFYTNIQGRPYPNFEYQDYKDKGFNFKIRLKKEGVLPAIAIGINDIAGTGFFSSEYIVGSYGIANMDFHLGLGWGTLNGAYDFKNPLTLIDERFKSRPTEFADKGGQFQPSRYFSDETASMFYGVSYAFNKNLLLKLERDTTKTNGIIEYKKPKRRLTLGFEYNINNNFSIGFSKERDDFYSLKFVYKNNSSSSKSTYKYKNIEKDDDLNAYGNFIKKLESNGVGVNKIVEKADSIGVELTQFSHPNLDIIEEIVMSAKRDSGITKDLKTDLRIANLQAYTEMEDDYYDSSQLIYERKPQRNFNTKTRLRIRPYLASREGFFKFAVLLENDSEYILKDNLFFTSNLKYSIKDNFDDLVIPPVDTYPAQVRSDVKNYLRNFENKLIIGRAQFDYYLTPKKNNHLMFTSGILEEMFSGYGFEYMYFDNKKNYGVGFEIFNVKKRDYELRFGHLEYKNTTAFINFYHRNYKLIPFDTHISFGEYLAGDQGATIEISRSYRNGAKFGVFATFTDVSAEQFGEGTFDKGIFFNIPVFKDFVSYTWRPLTKDPGARLNRKNNLHDLLIKFKPYND